MQLAHRTGRYVVENHCPAAKIVSLPPSPSNAPPLTGVVKISVDVFQNRKPTSLNFGDLDNHLKAVCDALNGICYIDDITKAEIRHAVEVKLKEFAMTKPELIYEVAKNCGLTKASRNLKRAIN